MRLLGDGEQSLRSLRIGNIFRDLLGYHHHFAGASKCGSGLGIFHRRVLCHKSGQYPESALRKFAAEMISLNGENALSVPYGFFPEKLPEALYSVVFS